MGKTFIQFIRELQESDDARKRRWLIGFAIPIMLVAIGVWGFMIRSNFGLAEKTADGGNSPTRVWPVLRSGVANIVSQFGRGMGRAGSRVDANLWQSTPLHVSSPPQDFVLDSIEPITPRTFNGN